MFVTLDVVEDEHRFVALWELIDGSPQTEAVSQVPQSQFGTAWFPPWPTVRLGALIHVFKRIVSQRLSAKAHEHDIYGQPM